MFRRSLVMVLIGTCIGSPALAENLNVRAAVSAAATRAAAQSQRPAARGENPYLTPGLVLVGAGGSLTVLAFVVPSGMKCQGGLFDIECGTTANKGLLFSGLGAVGLGAALIMVGEGKRGLPSVSPRPGGFVVRHRLRF